MEKNYFYANKITEYLELGKKVANLKRQNAQKEKDIQDKYRNNYQKIKNDLNGYIVKIKPTVETVCALYKGTIQYRNGYINLPNGAPMMDYSPLNACELAIKFGNEGIRYLTAVIQRSNVNTNLLEFIKRFNAIVKIYNQTDSLCAEAINIELSTMRDELQQLEAKQRMICKSEGEFKEMVAGVLSYSNLTAKHCMIGDSMDLETQFKRSMTISLGHERVEGKVLGVTNDVILSSLDWNLDKDGIAVIRRKRMNTFNRELAIVSINTMLQFLFKYPGNFKRLLICDSSSSQEITTFAGSLKEVGPAFFFGKSGNFVHNADEDIRDYLAELNRLVNDRIMLLGSQSKYSNIFEYNEANQDNPQPLVLAILNGYPNKYENAADDLISLLKNGRKAGVFFLINEYTEEDEDSKYFRKRLPRLEELTKNIIEVKDEFLVKDNKHYCWDNRSNNYQVNNILKVFKTSPKVTENKIVYLDNVVPKEDFYSSKRRKDFSKNLSIPIGKKGSEPISIDFRADGSTAHLALIGTTGSGKTAFINSLVLSSSKLYSPKELEFHLIVMVKGDFRIFEEEKLPHLKTVVTGDRIVAAADVLDFLDGEMKRRGELIGSAGSIYEYNKTAEKPLSRCVIIIDEFMRLVEGSDSAVRRIEGIAQVGRAYGISLVISSTSFPMEVNSIKPLMGNRIEFKAEEAAGQLIPEAANRQSELESVKGLCFYSHGGNLHNLRVAYSEEGQNFKNHITEIKNKFSDYQMNLQSEIKPFMIKAENDIPFASRRPRVDYEDGTIRTRLGKTYLSNKNLEFPFDSKNNLLFLFGHYLETKNLEASLIKDVLFLSKGVDEPTVYYLDMNRNTSLRRAKSLIKTMRDKWVLSGKMVYASGEETSDLMSDIKDLIETRENDEDSELYSVLVVVAKADNVFEDDDLCEELIELVNRGRENNVYFAIQCDEPIRFYGSDKYMKNAIIFPDRYVEGDDYSSDALCKALESTPAGATEKGRKLINNATASALDPKLHILCVGNVLTIFIPYEYSEDYLENIV